MHQWRNDCEERNSLETGTTNDLWQTDRARTNGCTALYMPSRFLAAGSSSDVTSDV